ncbi:MAG: D-tyrosyl-tRNA(Tyr) deacylase [Candidatus Marinimicrobia bacterium]|nr:D-tyrosyl-tRNA(Tyr) deacylase [Candidatus Neomarinimicrobiota bacterium]
MIAVIQRVSESKVQINGETVGEIGQGLLILLGVFDGDMETDGQFLADKIAGLRIFNDENGKMNLSIEDVGGSALVVSQFTLCGDWRKGRRPSYVHAAAPDAGERLYEDFMDRLRDHGRPVESGKFGAMMDVYLVNDGPVTFVLDSRAKKPA